MPRQIKNQEELGGLEIIAECGYDRDEIVVDEINQKA